MIESRVHMNRSSPMMLHLLYAIQKRTKEYYYYSDLIPCAPKHRPTAEAPTFSLLALFHSQSVNIMEIISRRCVAPFPRFFICLSLVLCLYNSPPFTSPRYISNWVLRLRGYI